MAQIHLRPGVPAVFPSAWLITPDVPRATAPVLAIHGLNREAEQMVHLLASQADCTGRTIIVPLFDRASWPRFQRAACKNRADWALLALLGVLRDEGWIGASAPDMSGFSGGAQFAHRFAWLYPAAVRNLCLVAPGWWTFPDTRGAYPLGIGPTVASSASFCMRANLSRFLRRDIHVMVGSLDVAQDKNLRQDADVIDQQGPNRVVRARNWVAAAVRATRQLGLTPRVDFELMDNCNHSFGDCVANGALAQAFVPSVSLHTQVPQFPERLQLEEVA